MKWWRWTITTISVFFVIFSVPSCSPKKKSQIATARAGEVVDSGNVGYYTSLKVDKSNNPHISYHDITNQDLKYAHFNGIGWNVERVDADNLSATGEYTSIGIDKDGRPFISYLDTSLGGQLKLAHKEGGTWIKEVIDSEDSVGWYTSLVIDSNNNIHISYNNFAKRDLRYAYYDGKKWTLVTLDSEGDVGAYTSLALDTKNRPRISYHDDSNGALKYASCNNNCLDPNYWVYETLDDPKDPKTFNDVHVGHFTSLGLDKDNLPHISYYDDTNQELKYAHFDGSRWLITVVDAGNVSVPDRTGEFGSLKIDKNNSPRIVYYNRVVGSLKLASIAATGVWNKTTLDGGDIGGVREFIGLYTSMDIDSNGILHISYFDETNKNLLYLRY